MLSPQIILIAIISYFVVLTAISYFTGKEDNNEDNKERNCMESAIVKDIQGSCYVEVSKSKD